MSGAAALSHQLLWTHRLTDLLGASADSTMRVFSCFFFGLALGAVAIGSFLPKIQKPWLAIALAEFGIALLCLPTLWLSRWTDWIWPSIGIEGLLGGQGALVKLALSVAVVLLPAFAMGTTLPLMVRAVSNGGPAETSVGGWLYALNTLGGLVGLSLTAGFSLYAFGVSGALLVPIGLNIAVGVVALLLNGMSATKAVGSEKQVVKRHFQGLLSHLGWKLLLTAFCSGFLILGLEIMAMELVMLVAPISIHAPFAVLGSFILALSVSAFCVPLLAKRFQFNSGFIFLILVITALATSVGPMIFVKTAIETEGIKTATTVLSFTGSLVFLVLAAFGPGLLLGGLLFPSVIRLIPSECDKSSSIGFLLAVNGLGGLIGAETVYRWLLPSVGVYVSVGVVGLLYLVLAVAWTGLSRKKLLCPRSLGLVAALGAVTIAFVSLRLLPVVNPNIGLKLLDIRFGREGNLAVVEHEDFGRGLLLSNQYLLGSSNVRYDQERQAHIPLILHPEPKKVCFIGLATGITPSAALQHSMVETIDIVELSSMVVSAAEKHFETYNADVVNSARVRVAVEDGRTFISAQRSAYDVVIADLFLPWRPGVGRLYSIEHFRAVREALRQQGMFCQWLPLYQFSESQLQLVMATFLEVFPDAHLIEGKFDLGAPVLGLVGFKEAALDWKAIHATCDRERSLNTIKDPTVRHASGLAMLYRGQARSWVSSSRTNSLDNMELELSAGLGRMLASDTNPYLVGRSWVNLLEHQLKLSLTKGNDEMAKKAMVSGVQIAVLRESLNREPELKNQRLKQVFALLPKPLRVDRQADWKRWAGPELKVRWKPTGV